MDAKMIVYILRALQIIGDGVFLVLICSLLILDRAAERDFGKESFEG